MLSPAAAHGVQPRLLLCDDSPVERLALAHFLRREGFNVDEAGDGESALEQLKNRKVDLLLLDLEMPELDGFDVLNYVREHRKALPVILLSGLSPDEIQQKMSNLHQPVLPPLFIKPVDPTQLVEVVELQLAGQISADSDAVVDEDA
ncbi:MAG TPA: response regulator [Tepidisphaeraceae bacterium]|jgi:DNA-binding response OmpR family regulator